MIDLTLAKTHLRVEGSAEDELIQSYIDAAAAMVEGATSQLLERREVVQPVLRLGGYVGLWWGPEPEGAVLDYLDADGAAQSVEPRLAGARAFAPVAGWPSVLAEGPVTVTYTAGFETVPADLVQAQLLLVAHWWLNRSAVSQGGAEEPPLGVSAICRRYRSVLI